MSDERTYPDPDTLMLRVQREEWQRAPMTPQTGWTPHRPLRRYMQAVGLVAAVTVVGELISPYISPTNLIMLYLLAVVVTASALGRGPSLLVSVLSVLAFDFFFVPPVLTFVIADTEYFLTFAGLLMVSLVISQLTVRVREEAEAAQRREAVTATLFALSRDLSVAHGMDDVVHAVIHHVSDTFGREVALLLPAAGDANHLEPHGTVPEFMRDQNELAVAGWAFGHGQEAGYGSATLPAAAARYMPLKTAGGVVGIIGVQPARREAGLSSEHRRLLEAFASLAALAVERVQLADAARRAQLLEATEMLQTALLNSISHDLRTPLVSVTGALGMLADDGGALSTAARRELIETAKGEAERLNRLVGNLLDMTRIEAGALRLNRQPSDVQAVIGSALEQFNDRLGSRDVRVDVPADLPLVSMDPALMMHVLVNVFDNALKYSPAETQRQAAVTPRPDGVPDLPRRTTGGALTRSDELVGEGAVATLPGGSPLAIRARLSDGEVAIVVSDRGVGIPAGELGRVFDKFYRVEHPGSVSGTGLGLSICKGIVEAHGGTIRAEQRDGGGTSIIIILPATSEPAPAGGGKT